VSPKKSFKIEFIALIFECVTLRVFARLVVGLIAKQPKIVVFAFVDESHIASLTNDYTL
jgi:hypothetical protein